MKKRILSFVLLLAMILTMIPVMASAEEATPTVDDGSTSSTEVTAGDLHDWYVQDGLTALYSAFGANNGVDLAAGTWTSKVGTGVATLGTKDRWSVGEYGGIGYTVLYGTVAEDGTYTKDSAFNNHNTANLRLEFGIAQLNNGDFTVDYMAMYKPLYVADTDGSILVKNGAKVESYDAFGEKQLPGGIASSNSTPIDKLGWLSSWSNRIDDAYWAGGRGELYWIYNQTGWYDTTGGTTNGDRLQVFTKGDPLKTNSVINTYSMWLDETVTTTPAEEEGAEDVTVTAAHFQLFRNGVYYSQAHLSTANNGVAGKTAVQWHDAGTAFRSGLGFSLSHASPVDFFSVRIYNRPLSTAEMSQNRAVDILLYYGIEFTEEQIANEAFKEAVLAVAGGYSFETDATAKEATANQLAAAAAEAQTALDLIALYADPDHMTSFYTTFIDGMVNVEKGTWTDLVGGGVATMGVPSRWFINEDGSFGYNAFVGYINGSTQAKGGTVDSDRTAINALGNVPTENHAYWKNNPLTFGMEKLPKDDFTVEYLAMYRPYYVADASKSTADQIVYAKDADGNLLEAYDVFGSTPTTTDYGNPSGRAIDSIGHYTTITQQVDGSSGWGGSVRGTQHWLYDTHAWSGTRNWIGGAGWGKNSGLAVTDDPFKLNNLPTVYAITLDETVTEEAASGNFGLYRNGVLYNESSKIGWADATKGKYNPDFDAACEFYLSCCQPTDFYAVRIYDKVLTEAEKKQNVAIDVILYYGIELSDELLANEDLMAEVYAIASAYPFVKDATLKNGQKAKLTRAIEMAANRADIMSIDNTLYVQDGLTSLFTAFERDVEYSVAMVSGNYTWTNRVTGGATATFNGGEVWSLGEYGGVEKTYIYGTMTDGVWSKDNTTSQANTPFTKDYSLNFGLDMLSKEDFTVEYLAYFPPMYAVDTATGELLPHYNGLYTETNGVYNVDRIGFIEFNSVYPGGTFDKMNNYLRGRVAPAACSTWGGATGGGTYGFGGTAFRIDRDSLKIENYAIMRDETTVYAEDGTTVTEVKADFFSAKNSTVKYSMLNFSTLYPAYLKSGTEAKNYQGEYVNGTTYANGKYYDYDDDTAFYLSRSAGATFYAVRIYNRVLSEAEMKQNYAADIVSYYDITIPAVVFGNEDLIEKCAAALSSAQIVTDYSAKVANKAKYQAAIDEIVAIATAKPIYDYDSLYVKDNLVALYTSFVGDNSADFTAGEWANKVEGGAAAKLNGAFWQKKLVGIGYTMDKATWTSVGQNSGIVLPDAYADLSTFTVETFASVIGITDANGDRYVNNYQPAVKDENGEVITPASGNQWGVFKSNISAFRFDLLSSLFFVSWDANTKSQSLASRWFLMNKAYSGSLPDTNPKDAEGNYDGKYEAILFQDGDTGWSSAAVDTFEPIAMAVSRTQANSVDTYALAYNGTLKKSLDLTAEQRSVIENATAAEANRFALFQALPANVYAIRVYSDLLTDAEKLQNSFVDKAAYFKVNLAGFEDLSDAKKTAVYEAFASIGTNQEDAAVQALYDFYANTDVDKLAKEIVTVDGYLPILSGAAGYRVLFKLNDGALELLRGADYEVSYGALIAAGGKYNTLENVVLGADGVKTIAVGGENGSGIYYNLAGAGGHYFTAAVTADDAAYYGVDMIVRGYVQITEPGGTVKTYYVDVCENEILDGEASILDVTDYFVNSFDGDVAKQYEYMNSAALRAILAEAGYASRVALDDDLVLYVDVLGDDGNNGLTANAAYATLEAAFAAAKAHLGKGGNKTVVINVADGTYTIDEPLTLDGAEILADTYSFAVKATGENVVINALTEIPNDADTDVNWADDDVGAAYVQLPADENGEYPALRAVYANGKLINYAHQGDSDKFVGVIQGLRFEDAAGNPIAATTKDWGLDTAGAAACKWAIYQLPLNAIKQDVSAYAGAELHHTQAWTFHAAVIDHVVLTDEYAEAYVAFAENIPRSYYKGYTVEGCAFWFEGAYAFLNENGDTYYYDEATGKLYVKEDNISVPELNSFAYSALENLVVLKDVKNVTFDGITFTGVDSKHATGGNTISISMGQAGSLHVGAEKVGFSTAGAILGTNVTNFTVKNSTFTEMMGGGINLRGIVRDVTIDSNVFTNLGDTAFRSGDNAYKSSAYTNGLVFSNNYVNNVCTLYKASVAVQSFTIANAAIIGNTVTNVPYSAFSFGWVWGTIGSTAETIIAGGEYATFNTEIAYNYITDFMTCMGDGGAFYLLGGNVKNGTDVDTYYNFMHHNYVNMSQATGLHVHNGVYNENGKRFTMGYYHDNSSSHWFDYENVLINSSTGTFSTYWLQTYEGGEAHSIKLLDNYLVGINKTAATDTWNMHEIYVNDKAINADFHISANDYIYENVAALKANTSIGVQTYNNAVSKNSTATAANDVAAIFAACGSSLAPASAHVSALDWTAPAAERVLLSDVALDATVTEGETETVTFTDGETSATVFGVVGTTVVAPFEFRNADVYNYTFTVEGDVIDLATWTIPEGGATVMVEANVITYKATLVDENYVTVTLELPVGAKIELPAEYVKVGYTAVLKAEGEELDLATYTMPARDIDVKVSYKINMHTVTITDGTTTKTITDAYGTKIPAQAANFVKFGHNTVFTADGVNVVDGTYTIPDRDVTINVTYTPKQYDVKFYNKVGATETLYATIKVTFGTAITLPDAPATWQDDTYEYTFAGWMGYTEGMILETEGATFKTEWTPELRSEYNFKFIYTIDGVETVVGTKTVARDSAIIAPALPESFDLDGFRYTFTGWEGYTEGMLATKDATFVAVYEKTEIPTGIVGDINGDGVVDISDITAIISAASGTALDPEQFPGETDLTADGLVDISDITAVIAIASGSSAE